MGWWMRLSYYMSLSVPSELRSVRFALVTDRPTDRRRWNSILFRLIEHFADRQSKQTWTRTRAFINDDDLCLVEVVGGNQYALLLISTTTEKSTKRNIILANHKIEKVEVILFM